MLDSCVVSWVRGFSPPDSSEGVWGSWRKKRRVDGGYLKAGCNYAFKK